MRFLQFFLVLSVFMLASFSVSAAEKSGGHLAPNKAFSRTWLFCQDAKVCTAIVATCGSYLPINKKYRRQAKEFFKELQKNTAEKCPDTGALRISKPNKFSCQNDSCIALPSQ